MPIESLFSKHFWTLSSRTPKKKRVKRWHVLPANINIYCNLQEIQSIYHQYMFQILSMFIHPPTSLQPPQKPSTRPSLQPFQPGIFVPLSHLLRLFDHLTSDGKRAKKTKHRRVQCWTRGETAPFFWGGHGFYQIMDRQKKTPETFLVGTHVGICQGSRFEFHAMTWGDFFTWSWIVWWFLNLVSHWWKLKLQLLRENAWKCMQLGVFVEPPKSYLFDISTNKSL